jgi:hypothetical protein
MKNLWIVGLLLLIQCCNAFAGDPPSGFIDLGELQKAKAQAVKEGKLIAIAVKGYDDKCPRCAAALKNGTRAIKFDCVMVFTRVSKLQTYKDLPAAVKTATQRPTDGAWVEFYVFDPAVEKLIAQAGRDELESNRTKIKAFRDAVDTARKDLTGK